MKGKTPATDIHRLSEAVLRLNVVMSAMGAPLYGVSVRGTFNDEPWKALTRSMQRVFLDFTPYNAPLPPEVARITKGETLLQFAGVVMGPHDAMSPMMSEHAESALKSFNAKIPASKDIARVAHKVNEAIVGEPTRLSSYAFMLLMTEWLKDTVDEATSDAEIDAIMAAMAHQCKLHRRELADLPLLPIRA